MVAGLDLNLRPVRGSAGFGQISAAHGLATKVGFLLQLQTSDTEAAGMSLLASLCPFRALIRDVRKLALTQRTGTVRRWPEA